MTTDGCAPEGTDAESLLDAMLSATIVRPRVLNRVSHPTAQQLILHLEVERELVEHYLFARFIAPTTLI
jgi:hypothetical protein